MFHAAEDSRRSADNRAAIGALIPSGELAKWKPERLARFCALTGQAARVALDADGSVLADVYRAADGPTRSALREAIAGVPELDLLRVVAGAPGGDRLSRVTAPEREYLVRELARREEWARLWEFATGLPLAGAAAVARQFAGRWRFPDRARSSRPTCSHGLTPTRWRPARKRWRIRRRCAWRPGSSRAAARSRQTDNGWSSPSCPSGRNVTLGIPG